MTTESTAADQSIRDQALDPEQSFIVQAPAGSGKTELLMQRYLALLATVDHPEEIIAITFTRKATAEMRGRIVAALDQASDAEKPQKTHELTTWTLAQKVLKRDTELKWNLLKNPNRLRIQTIDAMCSSFARQMPVLSRTGVSPQIVERADHLYRQAAQATLKGLTRHTEVAYLLGHLDNNWQKLEGMISSLLQKRDHWLRHLPFGSDDFGRLQERENLEASLCAIISETLEKSLEKIPLEIRRDWLALANFAASNIHKSEKKSSLNACLEIQEFPDSFPDSLNVWEGLLEMVLVKTGGWRKSVTNNIGFPAPSTIKDKEQKQIGTDMKISMLRLIENLQDVPDLQESFQAIRLLPSPAYSDEQWDVLQSLFVVLKLAVAQLQIVFREQSQVDFTEVSIAAVYALGNESEPTDLALSLDYKIKHLLVDEFQDTSVSQYSLLERITAGWELNDGRTLFLVGDPMQSIYRFREADVGLFINVQRQKSLGHIQLEPLQLSVNFRSKQVIVEWVNEVFQRAMPAEASVTSGAVSYTKSEAFHKQTSDASVAIHPLVDVDRKQEADLVCSLIKTAMDREETVAVLVRNRSHLVQITSRLKEKKQAYQAVEIESLTQQAVIRDLYSLTSALLHLADRTAWLAILRAPWCGLSLNDLELLSQQSSATIWGLINYDKRVKSISEDGQKRLCKLQAVMKKSLVQRQRISLARWVEGTWIMLGGPACLNSESGLDNAQAFFNLLGELDDGYELESLDALDQKLSSLFAAPNASDQAMPQLMTIHKSKGLEFDTVIIPGLERQPRNDDRQLLQWTEWRNTIENTDELLLAPIEETGREKERINQYLQVLEKERARHEAVRLLYVAATRAQKNLHLIGQVEHSEKGEIKLPDQRSLLSRIWSSVESDYLESSHAIKPTDQNEKSDELFIPYIKRLLVDWEVPTREPAVHWAGSDRLKSEGEKSGEDSTIEFSWAGAQAKHIGIVVHRILQQIAEEGIEHWHRERLTKAGSTIKILLLESGLPESMLERATKKVLHAIEKTLDDEKGRWILSNHESARNEYTLSGMLNEKFMRVVLDRTFIDGDGTRWIIDYKSSSHEGSNLEGFLESEKSRYQEQLESYAELIAKVEERPIKLALYFPVLSEWREWQYIK